MWRAIFQTVRAASRGYIDDACLSRGAAIAYYTVFALAPMLVIVIGMAGLVFGEAVAQGAVVEQIQALMGARGADIIQAMISGASHSRSGLLATLIGAGTLLLVATGVLAEVQAALNTIWKVHRRSGSLRQLVRARLQGLLLMLIMGFLLLLSLIATTALTVAGGWLQDRMPGIPVPLHELNFGISFALISLVFAAIYKVLPDTAIAWRDVGIGAVVTAGLFTAGKYLIALYVAHSFFVSSYGVAGTFVVVLLWFYYSSLIFLFGAELTFAYAQQRGSRAGRPRASASEHVAELRSRLDLEAERARTRVRPGRGGSNRAKVGQG